MEQILLLSSSKFLLSHPQVFQKPFREMTMVHVTTAAKGVTDTTYIKRTRDFFDQEGYRYQDLDLDGKDANELRERLSECEIVFVQGGNSFYLLKSIRECGFDQVIKELLPKGLIYMGASAGSYVACPTIEMATWKHQDRDHYGVTDFTGMGLVPFLVTVHYSQEYDDVLKEKIPTASLPVRILTDEQGLLIQDGREKLIGEGGEVQL